MQISSVHNQTIKDLVKLRESSRDRRSKRMFTIEGARELERALLANYSCETIFYCKENLSDQARRVLQGAISVKQIEVSPSVFKKLVVREGSDGTLALMYAKRFDLAELKLRENSIFLVFDQIEKPGNFGALARTGDGVGVDGIFVLDPEADLYNPHAIRSSVGAIFSSPLYTCNHSEFLNFCNESQVRIVTASPDAKDFYFDTNLTGHVAIVLGSEALGLSKFWDNIPQLPIKIPMNGLADSLNVSVAGAVILYEALRQRHRL